MGRRTALVRPRNEHTWAVTARAPKIGRAGQPPATITGTGTGEDELAALTDLVLRLREYGHPDRMAALERRMRLAYVSGAEGQSREALGRGLTTEELQGVVRRAPPTD